MVINKELVKNVMRRRVFKFIGIFIVDFFLFKSICNRIIYRDRNRKERLFIGCFK